MIFNNLTFKGIKDNDKATKTFISYDDNILSRLHIMFNFSRKRI